MIYGFVSQSGGHLRIDSKIGGGTTVRLYLPRADTDAMASDSTPEAAPGPGGDEAILLVDDNLTLRDVARRHLDALGYSVALAANAPAALDLLRTGARFDLLFTDVVMPGGMTGYELADAARFLQPGLHVLFTTGYDGELGQPHQSAHTVLRKPYRREELAQAIRATLDTPG